MNKNAIKKYAMWARRELISRVSQRAAFYGITKENSGDSSADSVNGTVFSAAEKKQRQTLIGEIKIKGYEEVMEEVAYTWFNRFSALRFMEVNGYLPTRVRVFTDDNNAFKPQILTEAIHMEMDGLDRERVYAYKEANENDALYRYLLITQCNALSSVLPGMFQRIADYTELLFPDNLLREGSVVEQMIYQIPEEDWRDQVQIIGWLYQYYNSEKKDEVFAALKKNVKITKENIPAATQLFTPDWIVRYMVENSLGRLWVSGQLLVDSGQWLVDSDQWSVDQWSVASGQCLVDSEEWSEQERKRIDKEKELAERMGWKYYLPEAEQEPEAEAQLSELRREYAAITPEQIRCVDPCAGSGHIITYLFDVLVQIYEAYGVDTRTAVSSIVENNIYGLDIDERAAQLAYFSLMMKACQYDRRFLRRKVQPHVMPIAQSNHVDPKVVEYFCDGDDKLAEAMQTLLKELHDAKEYGSILSVTPQDWESLYRRFEKMREEVSVYRESAFEQLFPLVQTAEALAKKYDVVVTNPPYMGSSNMNPKLNEFIKKHYADYKSDFFSAFVVHCSEMTKKSGYCGFFTPYVWMFIQSYEKMRNYLYTQATIETLIQFEYSAFEEATVPVCTFAFHNRHVKKKGCYLRLVDFRGGMEVQRKKTLEAIENHKCGFYYEQSTDNFAKIPGSPVAYWVSMNFFNIFDNPKLLDYTFSDGQNKTGNNDKYLRYLWEVDSESVGEGRHWVQLAKGGGFRKWYGNIINVIDWSLGAREHYRKDHVSRIIPEYIWYKEGITWGDITSYKPSFRVLPQGMTFETAGLTLFLKDGESEYYILGLLNTCIFNMVSQTLNATFHTKIKDVQGMPYIVKPKQLVHKFVEANIGISKEDWDSYETSWDFQRHPLVRKLKTDSPTPAQYALTTNHSLSDHYKAWAQECDQRFAQLKANEEELNRIFIDIYGLQDELTPEVADRDITVHRIFDSKDEVTESMRGSNYVRTKRDEIVSLISYAVGCMFGRYSLDVDGLAYAGGEWDPSKYASFPADKDNIIPICDDVYFEDDIVGRFVDFVKIVYGADTLEENLRFIADALGGKGQPREVIRNYFLKDFYKDHCKTYQKRPIYWLFDSGRKNGFKCLIYMHRYRSDTIARIRTDYVHEQQARYRTAIEDLENRIAQGSAGESVRLKKQLKMRGDQAAEIHAYEEKIHHLADRMISINLDDGVKHNYAIFQDVLAKIR